MAEPASADVRSSYDISFKLPLIATYQSRTAAGKTLQYQSRTQDVTKYLPKSLIVKPENSNLEKEIENYN